jgi:heparan-alpha-glucosaminide N-acetyltransferase
VVIGRNSIAAYVMSWLFEGFFAQNLKVHLGPHAFEVFGEPYEPLLQGAAVLLLLWLILFGMNRRGLYLRI